MTKLHDISVVIPLYNEAGTLPILYKRLSHTLSKLVAAYEILFVNDGSSDHSLDILKALATQDARVRYVSLTRNFGHQAALMAGLHKCSGKAVVIMDGDLQDPPEVIPTLYDKYREGYQVITASRKRRKGETYFKRLTAKMFYRAFARITNFSMPLDAGDFRLIDLRVVQALRKFPERNLFIRGQIAWLGFRSTDITFVRDERLFGKTHYSLGKMIRFAFDGITSFSNVPLKIATLSGFAMSGVAFIIILYALCSWLLLNRTVSGWTSLMISSMVIGGTQLITIGIVGEYLGRMILDVKQRPFYVVDEEHVAHDVDTITQPIRHEVNPT